jgi:hypothetical protein
MFMLPPAQATAETLIAMLDQSGAGAATLTVAQRARVAMVRAQILYHQVSQRL